jgi:uncharacterized repeat protein (TIGR03806 family)
MNILRKSLYVLAAISLINCGGGGGGSTDNGSPTPPPGPLGERPSNASCVAALRPGEEGIPAFTDAYPNLNISTDRKTGLKQSPGNSDYWYLADRDGRIFRFEANANVSSATSVMDIRDRVATPSERGLLGFAFSPTFASDGVLYVFYTTSNRSRISRFVSNNGGQSFPSTAADEQIIFEHIQEADNHNGGDLHFGPDGYLYFSMGDDGDTDNAQDLSDVRGSILRIDPNGDDNLPTDASIFVREYAIPANNPFVNNNNARPEIYAYGLRNPWRFTIDSQTGDLWVGDVGLSDREEIDLITAGGNYGWPEKEGTKCHLSNPCNNSDWIDPVTEYNRSEGLSVINGHVYRGSTVPALVGKLIFSEWSTGVVWALSYNSSTGEGSRAEIGNVGSFTVVSWGQNNNGEIYAATNGFPVLQADGNNSGQNLPQKLSESGCVQANDAKQKTSGLIPYDVNMPLWSDNAVKQRWLAIPDNTFITINNDGHWQFPIGSVLVKEFVVDGVLAETRLMMRHNDGDWAGYAYQWNNQGTDADLVLDGATFDTGSRDWAIPSAAQCLQCHTDVAQSTLGLETAQMNRVFDYAGAGEFNQLDALHQLNLLSANPGDPATQPALSMLNDNAGAEKHARDYLHVQCAQCHQPGSVSDAFDLRWQTDFADTQLCNALPLSGDLGVSGARLITPGSAAQSLVSLRMHATDSNRMPKIGTERVDNDAVAAVDEWINTLQNCPP